MSTTPQVEPLPSAADRAYSRPGAGDWAQALLIKTWSALKWITQRVKVQHARKTLRVCESVSLGDKRFVALVQVDDERFLIGGSSGSVSLLSRLPEAKTFAVVLGREAEKIS
jgi:flagellar biogenesis protein FliO